MEASKQTLVRKRASVKAALTAQERHVAHFEVTSAEDFEQLLLRSDQLKSLYSKFTTIQDEIESFELDSDGDLSERENFDTRYFQIVARCKTLMKGSEFNPDRLPRTVVHSPVPNEDVRPFQESVRLPEIKLPIFDGDVTNWRYFRDLVNDLIVHNSSLRDSAKFFHLYSCLSPNLQQAIANIPQSANNFFVAWNFLVNRYDNPRLLVNAHVEQIFNPPVYQPGSSTSLRALVDHVNANLASLRALELLVPIEDLLVQKILLDQFDLETRKIWEQQSSVDAVPTLNDLMDFVEQRARVLDVAPHSQQFNHTANNFKSPPPVKPNYMCYFCHQNHSLYVCRKFLDLPVPERLKQAKRLNLCINCLAKSSATHRCKAWSVCKKCGKHHHTLLHSDSPNGNYSPSPSQGMRGGGVNQHAHVATYSANFRGQGTRGRGAGCRGRDRVNENVREYEDDVSNDVRTQSVSNSVVTSVTTPHTDASSQCLLATAVVLVSADGGLPVPCRALLDGGSDCNLMTSSCRERLGLSSSPTNVNVTGLGLTSHKVTNSVKVNLRSTCTDFQADIKCLLVDKITSNLPSVSVDTSSWHLPPELSYADPDFHLSRPIDILLGAELFFNLLLPGRLSPGPQLPNLQRTSLGWVVAGSLLSNYSMSKSSFNPISKRVHCAVAERVSNEQLDSQLRKFWELEDFSCFPTSSQVDPLEKHFIDTTVRDCSGRYIVNLPKKSNHHLLGVSKSLALKRFYSLEKRLAKDSDLCKEYVQFMDEYHSLGHMQLVNSMCFDNVYHIPHHPVFKPSSSSTKLRVVFDASAPTTSGLSLNDTLQVGPTVQPDLLSIILRFRTRDVAIVADIAKMYRQVKVSPEDQNLQRIFWRSSPQNPVQEFQLSTVTYGTAPAAFLATRVLNQLAIDEGDSYPLAVSAVTNDFYVDDLISCYDDDNQAISAYHQLTTMLSLGGFELRKWASNSPQVLEEIPVELRAIANIKSFDDSSESSIQTLGLLWHVDRDLFKIQHKFPSKFHDKPFTKRSILSAIASIFDPLGLIAPVIILCKIFMQKLWMSKINWDHPVTGELLVGWLAIWSHLPRIADIEIPRLMKPIGISKIVHLHVFADASKVAYGAVAYLVVSTDVNSNSHLVLAKSRVAPLKPMTIPRLELSAALLAAKLSFKVKSALKLMIHQTWLWSDSTIVLAWIKKQPNEFKPFVSARLAEIYEFTHEDTWLHVPSKQNPADCITRGISPTELKNESLWWRGPQWLIQSQQFWPSQPNLPSDSTEIRRCNVVVIKNDLNQDLLLRYSSHMKLIRVMSYIRRFIHNLKSVNVSSRLSGPLAPAELDAAFNSCAKIVQSVAYSSEISSLSQGQFISTKSPILSLRPFLDNTGLLRVGGRLEQSLLPFGAKHQILLPRNHHFVKAYIRYVHLKLCHASAQSVMAEVRQRLWIPSLKGTIRHVHRTCVTCFKDRAIGSQQIMGQLPDCRVQPSPIFSNVGIDYAGPILVRFGGPRSRATQKCYLAVFVCMATTAVHVEPVTSLTTKAFLDAFSRFTSRRGFPSIVYSDNATNFKGAYREMMELHQFLSSQDVQDEVHTATSKFNVTWKFSPPRSPHFGGLWETLIKSLKTHFRKVTAGRICTFEEVLTLVTFIESILNSRPLSRMSEDVDDLHYLSPAHFLIGRPLVTLPFPNFVDVPVGRLDRYQRLQHSLSTLWNFWSRDYLMSLQRLSKWKVPFSNLSLQQLVLVVNESPVVNKWTLGVIVELHPGKDGHVRVVTVRTRDGLFKRAVTKVAPLPSDEGV